MWQLKKLGLLAVWLCCLAGNGALAAAAGTAPDLSPPPIQREFRGLWVATVDNIDWPSQKGLSMARQKEELITILDRAAALHFNVIVLQVRASCDAFYESKIEPWSEYLTGRMDQAPIPAYDPLRFAVTEAHKRGLALHAWFNPYRVRFRNLTTPVAPNHVSVKHPELVRAYGKFLWLDPGEEATREYSLSVVMDVVRRYDIDGVHFDDYFYPYPETAGGQEIDFPDEVPWRRYQEQGGKMTRSDWRRDNVNRFVQSVYHAIKEAKPWVQFGISPFGIWRPTNPPQVTGFDAYEKIYCDPRKWLKEGWVDYCAPQLYWPMDQKAQSFPALLQWWAGENPRHRILLAGMKVNGWKDVSDGAREFEREIDSTRLQAGASGEILWHAKPLFQRADSVAGLLQKRIYSEPALVPAMPWLGGVSPAKPALKYKWSRGELKLEWRPRGDVVWQWVLQKKSEGHWTSEILPGAKTSETVTPTAAAPLPEAVALVAVDRLGNVSDATMTTVDSHR